MTKAFLIDVGKCVGCRNCQTGCKDEHCGNDWSPIAKSQPLVGQFWMKVNEQERGQRPHVKVTYTPVMCQHCIDPACAKACAEGAIITREDGLVWVDPAKCTGCGACVDACPYDAMFFNSELKIAQKCTGCAHLLDDEDSPIRVPRCMDNCHLDVITFGEESELDLEGAETLKPELGIKTRVWYKNLPKRFIRGTVYDPTTNEVVIGANVKATSEEGTFEDVTNDWGDFWLKNLPKAEWKIVIEKDGKKVDFAASTVEEDLGLQDIALA